MDSYAYETDAGIVCQCSTTGLWYTPTRVQFGHIGQHRYITSHCRYCDTSRHWRGQAAYDPSQPQPHMHMLKERQP